MDNHNIDNTYSDDYSDTSASEHTAATPDTSSKHDKKKKILIKIFFH